jgi:hypothetical protein
MKKSSTSCSFAALKKRSEIDIPRCAGINGVGAKGMALLGQGVAVGLFRMENVKKNELARECMVRTGAGRAAH